MIKHCGILRNKEFREFFLNVIKFFKMKNINDLLVKEEITDSDILKFYFEIYNNEKSKNIEIHLFASIFEFKMNNISEDRLNKFEKMIQEKCPFFKLTKRFSYTDLYMSLCYSHDLSFDAWDELENRFLNEV
jgi:hypothetical protein